MRSAGRRHAPDIFVGSTSESGHRTEVFCGENVSSLELQGFSAFRFGNVGLLNLDESQSEKF
jgi:hypothetical protein